MKKKQFEALCKSLLPALPGFVCKGRLLFAEPVIHLLRGYTCDDSGFDPNSFAITVFFLPLYVPTEHLHYNTGHRLKDEKGCDKWWNLADPQVSSELLSYIKRDGLAFLEMVNEPSDVVTVIKRLGIDSDPYRIQAFAYSLAMADDFIAARHALDSLIAILDDRIQWQGGMMRRAEQLASRLDSNPQQAKELLGEWEQVTKRNLGI